MGGITSVKVLSEDRLEWVAEIAGVRRRWEAKILLEQIPDRRIAWAATEGATNAGAVTFEDLGGGLTSVRLSLEYEPEGPVELVEDSLDVVAERARGDLDWFKAFIESEGHATGAGSPPVNRSAARASGVDHERVTSPARWPAVGRSRVGRGSVLVLGACRATGGGFIGDPTGGGPGQRVPGRCRVRVHLQLRDGRKKTGLGR